MEKTRYKGIVSSIKISHNPLENLYTIVGDMNFQLKSDMQLELYQEVEVEDNIIIPQAKIMESETYKSIMSRQLARIDLEGNIKKINLSDKVYQNLAHRLMPHLKSAAELLITAFISGSPMVVRFHNDGDGSSGGIALYRALLDLQKKELGFERSVSWNMNKSIAYTRDSLYIDSMLFDSYRSAEKPLLIITDFGTSPESVEAINLLYNKFNVIWLDHHVKYDGFPSDKISNYINVCDFGGDSNFTAGLLTCIFAQIIADVYVEDIKEAALVSDYSTYADYSDENAKKNSILLDYLTSTEKESHGKPKQMDFIITDREKSDEVFSHAKEMLDESIDIGIKNVKSFRSEKGTNIFVLDFEHIAKMQFDYPLPGRYSSKLQDHMESMNNGNTITIVHYGNYISVRVSRDISDSVKLLDLIEKMKIDTKGAVSGGGHKQAASIKANKDNIKEVTKLLLAELGVRQDN